MHTAVGALKLLLCCAEVPVKSISALRFCASTRIATWICAPLSSGKVNSLMGVRFQLFASFMAAWRFASNNWNLTPINAITRRTDSSALSCTWLM